MKPYLDEKKEKVLDLDARRKIYEVVRKSPGCHFREIERRSGVSTGQTQYHLGFLSRNGLIEAKKDGNNVRYFSVGFSSDNKELLSLLRQKSLRGILLFILVNDGCNQEEVVEDMKLSSSTVSWHLKKLIDAGIIGFVRQGRKIFYSVLIDKEELVRLLITYRESFLDSLVDNVIEMWGN